jgi:Putative phage tail protein
MAFALPMAVSLGVSLLSSLLFPQPDVVNEGARVTDLKATGSDYGVSIPRGWGRFRVGGNLIWAREIKEVRTAEQQGGKGGPTVTNITYSYFGTFAVLLCHGPVVDVRRIWMNGGLVYNVEPGSSAETIANSNEWRTKYMRFYPGNTTQNPDDLIQATQGSNRTPAWRSFCYLVFDNLPLEDYGNRLPQIEVEVVERNNGIGPFVIIADIVKDICLSAGLSLSQIDTTELSCLTIDGFATNQVQEARSPIEELQIFHQFSIVEADGRLYFRQEKQKYAEAISRADLGCWEWGNDVPPFFEETILDYVDLPTEFRIEFVDGDTNHRNYEIYERMINEDTIANRNVTQFRTQVVSDISEARSKARILLETAQLRGRKCEFVLPIHYLRVDPGKVIWIELYPGVASSLFIIKKEIGVNGLIKYEAISYGGIEAVTPGADDFTYAPQPSYVTLDNAAYEVTPPSTLAPPYNPTTGTVTIPGTTDLRVYDIPLVGDSHPNDCGVYIGGAGGSDNTAWKGALVYVSRNAGASWNFVSRLTGTSIFGICNTVLPTGPTGVVDSTNTISVTLQSPGSLSSVTLSDFNRGAQVALIGNELVWFKNATLTAPRTYTLDTLFRGRRGTDWSVGGHVADERFALLTGYGERVELATADLGTTLQFKALTSGTAQDFDDVPTISLPFAGISQECYSPVNLAATKDNAGNISLVWDRRDRRAGDRTDYANFPLSEVTERYETEIRNAGDTATLRTINSTTPLVRYTAAQQVTDFGSVQATVRVRVYQISALLGRGYVGAATLTPSVVAAVPIITDFAPRAGTIGDTVRVYGSGFTGTTALSINGTAVTGLTVVSDTQATGVVGVGTTTGAIVLTTPGGTATSAVAFVIGSSGSGDAILAIRRSWIGL